jgi:glucokinase
LTDFVNRVNLVLNFSAEPMASAKYKTAAGTRVPRPSTNHREGHVIGVDIGGSNLRVALADIQGKILARWTASTKNSSSADMVVNQIAQGVADLVQQTGVRRNSLRAIGVGAPGVTDRDSGVVLATSYLGGWKDVPLGGLLQSKLGLPAVVENDVKLAAVGEHWMGAARGLRDFVFFAIGTGIAAGIFVNGELLHGPNWVAGEVGYLIVPGTPEAPAKRGVPGSLESTIGGQGIHENWLRSRNGKGVADVSATEIFSRALDGDLSAQIVLEKSARILAYAVYNMSAILNSSLFILGGGVGISEPLLNATRRVLEPYKQPAQPKLAISTLGQDAQLIGAIRLALDQAADRVAQKS